MNPEERDEELLREFLQGDSPLSRLYRRDAREEPSAQLDASVRAAARHKLRPKSRVAHGPFARHWAVPASLAAVLVLSVSVVLLTPDLTRQPDGEYDDVADRPLVPKAAMDREQDAAAQDRSTAGRASGLAPLQSPAKRQGTREPVEKSGEQRERQTLGRENVPAGEQQSPPAPATGAGVAEEVAAPSASRSLVEPPPEPFRMPADSLQADPAAWLRLMESLLKDQKAQAAKNNLRAFRARYPDFPLPATLMPLAASLDAERP